MPIQMTIMLRNFDREMMLPCWAQQIQYQMEGDRMMDSICALSGSLGPHVGQLQCCQTALTLAQ